MEFQRSQEAVIERPGNGQEQAFSDGYKSVTKGKKPTVYAKQNPAAFKAGKAAAQAAK